MQVNYLGIAYMLRAAMEGMQGGSHIVVISSLSGVIPLPYRSGYCASKAAVNTLVDTIRIEEPKFDITLVCPSTIDTNFRKNSLAHSDG